MTATNVFTFWWFQVSSPLKIEISEIPIATGTFSDSSN